MEEQASFNVSYAYSNKLFEVEIIKGDRLFANWTQEQAELLWLGITAGSATLGYVMYRKRRKAEQ